MGSFNNSIFNDSTSPNMYGNNPSTFGSSMPHNTGFGTSPM